MSKSECLTARCAGSCYPANPKAAHAFFPHFFDQVPLAPAPPTPTDAPSRILGCVAPHIDFRVNTTAYGWAYHDLLPAPWADTYLILGVGHHAHLEWSTDSRSYATPLGTVDVDLAAVEQLRQAQPSLLQDPRAHQGEHSIEFPLVCLQAFRQWRGCTAPFRFLPILCGGLSQEVMLREDYHQNEELFTLARTLKSWWDAQQGRAHVIVSIDGCHLGPRFEHDYRVTPSLLELTQLWEERLWEKVEQHDLAGFIRHLQKDGNARYFDGVGALALLLTMFGKNFTLQRTHYTQWFEPSDHSAVTFTSGTLRLT